MKVRHTPVRPLNRRGTESKEETLYPVSVVLSDSLDATSHLLVRGDTVGLVADRTTFMRHLRVRIVTLPPPAKGRNHSTLSTFPLILKQ